jgi:predicted NAD/FAD-binding protein
MKRVAVIGAGISGLAAAYYLSRRHQVHVFEKEPRIGGHTHTVMVDHAGGPLAIDTGFVVHNERTYPTFCRLMRELGVETQASDMSFAVTDREGFEYSSRGLRGFFANPRQLLAPSHYRLFAEILRFHHEAPRLLEASGADEITLGRFLRDRRFHRVFIDRYLIPMTAAVWSMAPEAMLGFPAATLIRFMQNHGMLGVNTHPQWRSIRGGSHRYLDPLTKPFRHRIRTSAQIERISRSPLGVTLWFTGEGPQTFDEIVFACHGDQVVPLLADASNAERSVMASFGTTANEVCLHTDSRMLPHRPAARASWNYLVGRGDRVSLTYHMNRLQALNTAQDYCVTLNASGSIAAGAKLREMVYEHPLYTRAAVAAQKRWSEISGHLNTHFCGAYWFNGFHEDGVRSALRVAEALGVSEALGVAGA